MGEFMDQLLVVDDDKDLLKVYEKIFKLNHFDVLTAWDGPDALELIKRKRIGVVVADIIMPKMNGIVLLERIKEINSAIQVIMLTAEGSVSGAVDAVKSGAFTYILKPADIDNLLLNIQKAFEIYRLSEQNSAFKDQMLEKAGMMQLVGQNYRIEEIRQKIDVFADSDAPVLITGESGTGKEIIASQIHYKSNRAEQVFIKVNCAALSENLLESELFGHEKGSFTGADKMHRGKFEVANQGTILLDEIGELSLGTQAKLLRVLQEREFERVGGNGTIRTNFRLITSTNKNLKEEVEKGRFRKDLYYRIHVLPIHLPPLRERKDDIPILANYFTRQISKETSKCISPLSPEIIQALERYSWPGNVRELRNIIERLVVMTSDSEIKWSNLPDELKQGSDSCAVRDDSLGVDVPLLDAKKAFEKQYIIKALSCNQGNVGKTAMKLQLARKNLYKKIKEYDIHL
ncbi:sigma-54-dependent transcriptional regulator [Aminipila luticellarii]|uniref:Stage 0 sporulation protein A homolog n=1 Tax=Aminipila luticellarii TaxID=2507160 RepID=A0A410PWG2_9FIRM|nr:sigma-54 dependent transcriptional regulator [Aminipila luticellarii]QAT43257.1 sigma-54-dependent Fis family transcriptional regulator [Aminipila luticellarii]